MKIYALLFLFFLIHPNINRAFSPVYCTTADTSTPTMLSFGGFPPHLVKMVIDYHKKFKEVQYPETISQEEIALIRHGDIILRNGMGATSAMLADLMNEPYRITHSAILWKDTISQRWMVIHTQPSDKGAGIMEESLDEFVKNAVVGSLVVLRVKDATETDARRFVQIAKNLKARRVPFDFYFNSKETSRLYCSELIAYVLQQVYERDLMPMRITADIYDIIGMCNFFETGNFEIVLSHLNIPKKQD